MYGQREIPRTFSFILSNRSSELKNILKEKSSEAREKFLTLEIIRISFFYF